MDAADFLFPTDLRVTEPYLGAVLVIGGCGSAAYAQHFSQQRPQVGFDFLLFNNLAALPEGPPRPAIDYAFQVIELPLREIVGDATFRFAEYDTPARRAEVRARALQACRLSLDAAMAYSHRFGLLTFVTNFVLPQAPVARALDRTGREGDLRRLIRDLNDELAEAVADHPNAFVSDLDAIGGALGKQGFLDDALYFFGHSGHWRPGDRDFDVHPAHNAPAGGRLDPLPLLEEVYEPRWAAFFDAVWRQWEGLHRTALGVDQVKLVVFDLDDTLWRGQIGEHYADIESRPVFHGWPTGMWELVHHLRARGILTAVCSRNDDALVRARWDHAVHDGWLRLDDFSFVEIGWAPKAEAIARMVGAASLTPKSVVFVDDNPVEREAVRAALPGVRVLGDNPYATRRILLWAAETQVPHLSEEAQAREAMVAAQQAREIDREALSREAFLQSLDACVELFEVESSAHPRAGRAFELLNKTNQFNTTGRRWTAAELEAFRAEGGRVFAFTVQDRFTAYGLVGVALVRAGEVTQFVMSCRVIGLEVETSVVAALARLLGGAPLTGAVQATESNAVSRDLFARAGFVEDAPGAWRAGEDAASRPPAAHLQLQVAA